ncbi:uncharacterized protein LOC110445156 [Mizuhopecten yessoensis]|uniref:Zinc finger SWIM domain-containing protein 8 n=1 Tax=Mizuhopecten yessoensis TaxID=6573 RepID=A0A210R089_MIZYE|nr:uncharacterized protein LOC110445156 [Mizuhopecten yessoensis]OWF54407.1 Zinc finger SWIM domain-containing protein 8 [Mizuhopecten yessoensis]
MSGLLRFGDDSRSDFLEDEDNDDIEVIPSDDSSDLDSDDEYESESFISHLRRLRRRSSYAEVLSRANRREMAAVPKETSTNLCNAVPLLDLAASATALHHSLESLEKCDPPLDQLLLRKISRWSFPCDENKVKCCARLCLKTEAEWRKADRKCMDGYIRDMTQVGLMLSAVVGKPNSNNISKVTLKFEKQTIVSTKCSRCPKKLWCCHILSVALHRIRHAETVPVHPPMTEILSDLSRDQLQKLLQCAIADEPESLLPVFSNIDMVQDRKSILFNQSGAPDPTFGMDDDIDRTWDLSLDKLEADMKGLIQIYEYPSMCDFVKKAASPFHRKFFQRVPELINSGHTEQAGKVLIIIARCLLDAIPMEDDGSISEAFTDVERMFSCFISSYGGKIREDVITFAVEINKKCKLMRHWVEFIQPSSWSRISSIGLDSCLQELRRGQEARKEVLEVSSLAAFYQPVCASLIPVTSKALNDLLSGLDQPLASKYDEALPVMLLRFDNLVLYGSDQSIAAQYRLGVVILKKLLLMSSHLSILGHKSPAFKALQLQKDDDLGPSEAKKARLEAEDSAQVTLEAENSAQVTLPERQMTYAMLYICFILVKTKYLKKMNQEEPSLQVVIDSMFRAIELGRFRPLSPGHNDESLDYEEFCWLHELENELKLSFIFECGQSHQVEQCYVNALLEQGTCFYGNDMPIALLHMLVKAQSGSDNEDTFVKICLEAVCFSTAPFKGENPEIFAEFHEEHWSVILCTAYKVFFCENSHVQAEKLIDHFSHLQDGIFARIAYDAFEAHVFTDRWGKDDLDVSSYPIRFVLCLVKQSLKQDWDCFKSQMKNIADMLGMIALQEPGKVTYHLLEQWSSVSTYFSEAELQKFLDIMQKFVADAQTPPPDAHFQLVFDHIERADISHKPNSCYVLQILNTETLRQKALEKVKWNYKCFTPKALLWIAQSRHEMVGPPSLSGSMFCRIVFHLLQQAFYKIREQIRMKDILTFEKDECVEPVKWFFKAAANQGNEKLAKGNQFDVFLRELSETFANEPMFILHFFETISVSSPLLIKATKKLGCRLMIQLQSTFTSDIEAANTVSEYDIILDRLLTAQQSCLHNGICSSWNMFYLNVTLPIRLHHCRKEDFIAHMDKDFGSLLLAF